MANGEVKIDIVADDSQFKSTLEGVDDEAKKAAGGVDDLGDSAEDAGKSFGIADVAIGNFISNGLSNLAGKVTEAIGSIIALADETREYREDMAKLDTAFSTAGHSTDTAKQAYNDFYKILGESDRSVEAVNHLAELTNNEKEVAQWSTICAGVTAKFGDSLPIEGLTEAANETAKVGQVTGPLADALNWAGISEDEFNKKLAECNSEQERATLITETLNQKYQAAADEYNELTASTQAARDATNNMEQAQANMGAAIEPLTTAWTNFKANAMEALQPAVEGVANALSGMIGWLQEHPAVLTMLTGALTALAIGLGIVTAAVVAQTVAQWAQNAAWLASPITWIILAIVAAVGALVAGFMYLWENCEGFREFWTTLWEGIKVITEAVVTWLKEAFSQAWEGIKSAWNFVQPYFSMLWEGIKAVFSVVKTWFSGMFESAWTAIKVIWDAVKGYFQAVWDSIKLIFSVVKSVLQGNWKDAWNAIKGIVDTWKQYFSGIWDGIKAVFSAVGSWFGSTFSAAWTAIKSAWSAVTSFFSGIWDGIKNVFSSVSSWFSEKFQAAKQAILNVFSNIASNFLDVGTNIVQGIWNGISNGLGWIKGLITGWVGDVKSFIKNLFGIASPSKWARDEVGKFLPAGIAVGWEKGMPDAEKQIGKDISGLQARIQSTVSAENARMTSGVGVRDMGFSEVAQAVGMQTAGINSLASEYRKGSSQSVTVPLVLDGRELGRAIVDLGSTETNRTGLVFA